MSLINTHATVGDIVLEHPEAKPALERLGIDYCCGGEAPLEEAVRKAGRTLEETEREVAREIEAAKAGPATKNWAEASLGELAQHILDTHHVFMKATLPRLEALFSNTMRAHGASHGDTLHAAHKVYAALRHEIEAHLWKEEEVLFPYIFQIVAYEAGRAGKPVSHCGTVENPVRQMRFEHDNAGQALARLREITSDYQLPGDACETFATLYETLQALETDLHEHIHLENNILFPKAVEAEERVQRT